MLSKPSRGGDIVGWCERLWQDLQPLLGLKGDGRHIAVSRGVVQFIGTVAVEKPFRFLGISAGIASFRPGRVLHGQRILVPASMSITVAGGTPEAPVYVSVRYQPTSGADGAVDLVLTSSYPQHTALAFYRAIASFAMVGSPGVATLQEQVNDGDWDLTQVMPA